MRERETKKKLSSFGKFAEAAYILWNTQQHNMMWWSILHATQRL